MEPILKHQIWISEELQKESIFMEINNRFLFKAKRIDNGEWVQGSY